MKKLGASRLPLRDTEAKNTVELSAALETAKHRPDVFTDHTDDSTLDTVGLQIGLELKRARVRKGWTQADLAQFTGIHQSAISAIECGRGRDGPSFRTIKTLADALDAKLVLESSRPASEDECRVVSRSPSSLVFADGIGMHECWSLVRTLLDDQAYAEISNAMHDVLTDYSQSHYFDDQAVCGLWRMEAQSHARLLASTEILVVTTAFAGAVTASVLQLVSGGNFVVGKGEIQLVNNTVRPMGVLTVPCTSCMVSFFSDTECG